MSDDLEPPPRNKRIAFLDYLRIFAFTSVLIGHNFYMQAAQFVQDTQSGHAVSRLVLEILLPLFYGGGVGVVVFFLVSGYIITHVLQTERPLEFALKRIFRIYPLYVVVVLVETLVEGGGLHPGTLVPQLLLIGDFFGTPYTLAGVEWTLRVEVLFYLFMGVLRALDMLHTHRRALPWVLACTALILGLLEPTPAADIGYRGYLSIYGPFLLLGAFFRLEEQRQICLGSLFAFAALVLCQHYLLVAFYQPSSLGTHFAMLGLLLFVLAWRLRARLVVTATVLFLSDLTYSVYLMHKWAWMPIGNGLNALSIALLPADLQTLIVLLLSCYLAQRVIEKPGNRLGHRLSKSLRGTSPWPL